MNCKPGDLAIIIKEKGEVMHTGKIVAVKSWHSECQGWICNPDLIDEYGAHVAWIDDHLRPIRDPGDDATDEMIQRLGSPNKQEQKA